MANNHGLIAKSMQGNFAKIWFKYDLLFGFML